MRSAVLDLGSNSFHLLVADLEGRTVSPVYREREMLHLGRVVARCGAIPEDARRAAVATVARFARLARHQGAEEPRAVATAALREAVNGPDIVREMTAVAGIPVRVLDGLEEARMAYAGVRAAVAVRAEPVLVLDLGGGSLELVAGDAGRVEFAHSVHLGASRLTALVENDPLSSHDSGLLRRRIDECLEPLLPAVLELGAVETVVVGGTVRALARVIAAQHDIWLPSTLNQFQLRREHIDELTVELLSRDLEARKQLPAMKERRADHLHVAALVLSRTLELLDLPAVTVSDWGLREGVLLDLLGPTTPTTPDELRTREVDRIRTTFISDDPHPIHVAGLAEQLFDGTPQVHGLGDADRELLRHAAALHTIGEAIALRRQHLHGAYLVQNAELRGFSPTEIAILTTLVRFHRSRGIDPRYAPFAGLSLHDRGRTARLLALLQVADALDGSRDQTVSIVEAQQAAGMVEVTISGTRPDVLQDELARGCRLFERVLEVGLTVRSDDR